MDRDAVTEPPDGTKIYKDNWDFKVYLDELNTAVSSQIFKHNHWIEFYYKWAAFRDYNLVVRVRNETNTAPSSQAEGLVRIWISILRNVILHTHSKSRNKELLWLRTIFSLKRVEKVKYIHVFKIHILVGMNKELKQMTFP